MIRVVLDTNVVVSALLVSVGLEDRVLKLVLHGDVQLYVSAPILEEYERVLHRPKLAFSEARIRSTIALIRKVAESVRPMRRLSECRHEEDNRFLECADAGRADFLITANKKHFPGHWKQIAVVNAREFLDLIGLTLRR